jgi:hypothetical protein
MQWFYWLAAVILSLGAGYWVYRADKRRAVPYPTLTSALRALVVFLTLLLILVPTISITRNVIEKPIVLLLQDDSRSIANALGNDSTAYRKRVADLCSRLSGQYKVVQWRFGANAENDSTYGFNQPATDISAALSRAQEYYGLQNLGAVILATDGRYNQGTNPLFQQLSLHSALYSVGIGDSTLQKDIRITGAYANKTTTINSSFEVRADVVGELCKGYNNSITLKEDGAVLASVPVAISTDKYDRAVSFSIKATKTGMHHYTIELPEAEGEKNIANNRKDLFVDVIDEKKNILIAFAAPDPDVNAIKDALAGMESYRTTIVSADNIPSSLAGYSAIILHGLPSARSRIAANIIAARKPVWLILTQQTDVSAINSMEGTTHVTMTASGPRDVLPQYNTAFNTFILPQQIQAVADKMPPLTVSSGYINTSPAAGILFSQKSAPQLPLWVMQQGTIPVAILAGTGIWRWRLYEYKNFNDHSAVDECIRQTIAFLCANSNEKPFRVSLPKYVWGDQENIALSAYLLNTNNEQVNTPDVQLTISDSAGHKQNYSFERNGSAYSLNLGLWAGGTYTYTAHTKYNEKEYSATGSFVVESLPLELMQTGADYPLLYSLAKKYNGSFVPSANIGSLYDSISRNTQVRPVIQSDTETVPLVDRKWYFFLILLLATGEWLLRKYWLAQ